MNTSIITWNRTKCIIILSIALGFLIAYSYNNQGSLTTVLEEPKLSTSASIGEEAIREDANKSTVVVTKWDKWIVVTSINYPTDDVKRLASLTDWRLCVVADTKTPSDWHLENVYFLSVKDQEQLKLKLPKRLPFKSYTRKAVGYLFAIQNGAQWIYDTDDDNKPYGNGLSQFDFTDKISGMRFRALESNDIWKRTFNPYRYFGRRNMWPRGYPLEYIFKNDTLEAYESCQEMPIPVVQQGLVHNDPDVDAIYRLLNADPSIGLQESFDKFAPVISLEPGTFAPWNSQNTLFHRDAFFTMFLPTTVEFRATDIWRSFFSQKLLHLIGKSIAFYPTNAVQIRNAHNYLNDFKDENAVYHKAGDIVRFLDSWTCNATDIYNCTKDLAKEFALQRFWRDEDTELVNIWLEDLKEIGYIFLPLNNCNSTKYKNCRSSFLQFDLKHRTDANELEIARMKGDNFDEIVHWCSKSANFSWSSQSLLQENETALPLLPAKRIAEYHNSIEALSNKRDSVLIISNNYPWKTGIGLLQRMYSGYFAHVIFCGTFYKDQYNWNDDFPEVQMPFSFINISESEMREGYFHYLCLAKVRDLRMQNVKGYFFASDDAIFNIWTEFNMSALVIPSKIYTNKAWWPLDNGYKAIQRVNELFNTKYKEDETKQRLWKYYLEEVQKRSDTNGTDTFLNYTGRILADLYYVPSTKFEFMADMFEVFAEAGVFLELALRKVAHAIDFESTPMGHYIIPIEEKKNYQLFYNETISYLHPVKFSYLVNHEDRFKFCNSIIATFYKKLYS